MTDIYTSLFGTEPPWAQRRGERRNGTDDPNGTRGLTIGGMVGNRGRNMRSVPQDRPTGPIDVTQGFPFPMGEPHVSPEDQARIDSAGKEMTQWAREAHRAARRAQLRPRLPADAAPNETRPTFPFPMGQAERFDPQPYSDRAARVVGIPASYVNTLVMHESGGDPEARAPTSSATGLGQFIDQTWRDVMRDHGASYGYGEGALANLSDADLLDLRADPQWSTLMVAEMARRDATQMRTALKRDPRQGEVYLAHFLGVNRAIDVIRAAEEDRNSERRRSAASIVGEGPANANRPIFYDGNRARSAAEVVAIQSRDFSSDLFVTSDRGSTQPAGQR